MESGEYVNIKEVAIAKGLTSTRSIRMEINKTNSKYIARKVPVVGGESYEILFSTLEPDIQEILLRENKVCTALVPINNNINNNNTNFVSESSRLTALARADLLQALINFRKKYDTKKQADADFLDLYNSGMYLPKVYRFIGKISIGTLNRWCRAFKENGTVGLIPNRKCTPQGEYNTILNDEMKSILLNLLLNQNQFNYNKAIALTKEILRKRGYRRC